MVGRGNKWESPWWWRIWSFRIHATPPCLTWLIKSEGGPPAHFGPVTSRVVSTIPGESSWPVPHLCSILIEAFCAQFYHCPLFPLGAESIFSQQIGDVMTTRTSMSPALQRRVKGQQTPLRELVLGSAAELSHFRILWYWSHFEWHSQTRQIGQGALISRPQWTDFLRANSGQMVTFLKY